MKVQSKSISMITFFALAAILVNPSFQKDAKADTDFFWAAAVVGTLSGAFVGTCLRSAYSRPYSGRIVSELGGPLFCLTIGSLITILPAKLSAQTLDNKVTERDAQLLANLPANQKARITQLALTNASHEAIISELSSTSQGRAVMNEFLLQSRPEPQSSDFSSEPSFSALGPDSLPTTSSGSESNVAN